MDDSLISSLQFVIGVLVASAAMYVSAVLLLRISFPLWLRVALGLALLSAVPFLIVLAPESVTWRWLAAIAYCLGFGINQVAAPWRVRTGQAA